MWHIDKNIFIYCKKYFSSDDDWNSVARLLPRIDVDPLQRTILASPGLDSSSIWGRLRHLGWKSAHRLIKSYVNVSTSHLCDVQQKIDLCGHWQNILLRFERNKETGGQIVGKEHLSLHHYIHDDYGEQPER
ncbi:hypothetical protein BC941DRAFT_470678 [Chlamydoabsidia padenii]|nr:hypothetical protein BC941DRAFT_470678 [Chlamydoabsidia padenii]